MKRNPSFDLVKFVLLLGVIAGHLAGYGVVDKGGQPGWVTNLIIGVSMPAFFMISGYFARSLFENGTCGKIAIRTIRLVWPQLFVAIFLGVVMCAVDGLDAFRSTVREMGAFWFLKTLAFVYLFCGIIFRLCKEDLWRWIGLSAFYLIVLFLPEHGLPARYYWWIGYAPHMIPYFIFGLMVLRRGEQFRDSRVALTCGFFFLGVILLEGDCSTNGMSFYVTSAHLPDAVMSWTGGLTFVGRTVLGVAGSIFVLYLAEFLSRRFAFLSSLSLLGTTTLGVYVIHEWFVMKAGQTLDMCPLPCWLRWPLAVICYLVCHFVVLLISRCEIARMLFFGDLGAIVKSICRLAGCHELEDSDTLSQKEGTRRNG